MGVGEILDVSIKLYLKNFWALVKTVAVVVLPVSLLGFTFVLSSLPEGVIVEEGRLVFPDQAGLTDFFTGTGISVFLAVIAALLATGAAFKAVGDAYLGRQPQAGASLRFAGKKVLSLLWVGFLTMVVVVAGLILLVIPGIYMTVALMVVVPVLMVEDIRGFKALRRSRGLVKGRWWSTFGLVILGVFLIPGILQTLLVLPFQLFLFVSMENVVPLLLVEELINVLASVLTTPFTAAVLTVLYFDLRVRKEAFDLELLAGRIGEPALTQSGAVPPPPE